MAALLSELHAPLAKIYGRELLPPKIFRLNRDVRFSKNKNPYKTWCAGVIHFAGPDEGMGKAALYLHLGLDEAAACGFYMLEPDTLLRLRKAILAERTGAPLAKLVAAAQAKGLALDAMETLKRAPQGVPHDHPRVEILKRKGLALEFGRIPAKVRHSAELKPWLLEQCRIAAPVVAWGFQQKL